MDKISACLVVRNEEGQINGCLQSMIGAVDEIIIVHDGECVDQTIAICQKFGLKVIERPFAGYMEAHLPFCFSQAHGEWLLRIDADERLSVELKNQLGGLAGSKTVNGYEFLWPFYDGEKTITNHWPYKRCLFRKSAISFIGSLHEPVIVKGKVGKSDLILEHRPNYDNFSWSSFRHKWLRWAKLQAEIFHQDFKDIEKFNCGIDRWPVKVRTRKNLHLLLALPDFCLAFFKTLLSDRGYKEGAVVFRYAFFSGLYKIALDYYLFLIKINRRKNV